MQITKTGKWGDAHKKLSVLSTNLLKAGQQALLQEGLLLEREIKQGIQSQAPGGTAFAPLKQTTLAVRKFRRRGGSKVLQVTNALTRSTTTKMVGHMVFVGILRGAKSKDGRSLANIGDIHETGRTFTITVTPKMRRFLFAAFRKAGIIDPAKVAGPAKKVWLIHIKARPFMMPAFKKWKAMDGGIRNRYSRRLERALGLTTR